MAIPVTYGQMTVTFIEAKPIRLEDMASNGTRVRLQVQFEGKLLSTENQNTMRLLHGEYKTKYPDLQLLEFVDKAGKVLESKR